MQKRGQVTIFLILGVIILFIFLFLTKIQFQFAQQNLQRSQEEVLSGVFSKEALRLAIKECLAGKLETGLRQIGEQGRLWQDQGSDTPFLPGENGVQFADKRVSYGLIHLQDEPQYPCRTLDPAPFYCRYAHPAHRMNARFGEPQPLVQRVEDDLRMYLEREGKNCVTTFLQERVPGARFDVNEFTLDLQMYDDHIKVGAFFPLEFQVGTDEFFHLTTFDFRYPTQLRRLLKAAVSWPLYWDWQYVEFPYTQVSLEANSFTVDSPPGGTKQAGTAEFSSLATGFVSREETGDSIFSFTSPHVLREGSYEFFIARQNRPPALDMIERAACPSAGYDYLVVPGSINGYDTVSISLSAKDPDEDNADTEQLCYLFIPAAGDSAAALFTSAVQNTVTVVPSCVAAPGETKGNLLSIPSAATAGLPSGIHTLTAKVRDKDGAADWQDIRILVDQAVTPGVAAKIRTILPYDVPGGFPSDLIISKEDPIILEISMPGDSTYGTTTREITFTPTATTPPPSLASIPLAAPAGTSYQEFPEKVAAIPFTGTITDFTGVDLEGEAWGSGESATDILEEAGAHKTLRQGGTFTLNYETTYCTADGAVAEATYTAIPQIAECIPHRNPERPWPAPYHGYKYRPNPTGVGSTFIEKEDTPTVNLFLATHACCVPDATNRWKGTVAAEGTPPSLGTVCFEDPKGGCYGTPGLDGSKAGYILERKTQYCDGLRGNFCGGEVESTLVTDRSGSSICGDPAIREQCTGKPRAGINPAQPIPAECQGKPAWSKLTNAAGTDGVCFGDVGCEEFCTQTWISGRDNIFKDEDDVCGTCTSATKDKKCSTSYLGESEIKTCKEVSTGVFECKS